MTVDEDALKGLDHRLLQALTVADWTLWRHNASGHCARDASHPMRARITVAPEDSITEIATAMQDACEGDGIGVLVDGQTLVVGVGAVEWS